jgi:hypothetical protein
MDKITDIKKEHFFNFMKSVLGSDWLSIPFEDKIKELTTNYFKDENNDIDLIAAIVTDERIKDGNILEHLLNLGGNNIELTKKILEMHRLSQETKKHLNNK